MIYFDEWMESALYDPVSGYYMQAKMDFGQQGDFVTAPEISAFLFGGCLARSFKNILKKLDHPVVLELGAGTGKLAAEILKSLEKLDALPVFYFILERSGSLKKQQVEFLKNNLSEFLYKKIVWLSDLKNFIKKNQKIDGIIFGNEVCDALPVKLFKKINNTGCLEQDFVEMGVLNDTQWVEMSLSSSLLKNLKQLDLISGYYKNELSVLPIGYQSEVCVILEPWVCGLAKILNRGAMFWIDYGYPRREYYSVFRKNGTLLAYYQHKAYADPLEILARKGQQDLTAHVDFTALAEAGLENNLEVLGYTSQMMFLADAGIAELSEEIQDALARKNQLTYLTHPDLMGEQFKVIAMGRDVSQDIGLDGLVGFRLKDERIKL